jgi:hypothetical protein
MGHREEILLTECQISVYRTKIKYLIDSYLGVGQPGSIHSVITLSRVPLS